MLKAQSLTDLFIKFSPSLSLFIYLGVDDGYIESFTFFLCVKRSIEVKSIGNKLKIELSCLPNPYQSS